MRGGKRLGAGRKVGSRAQHTIEASAAKAYVIKRVIEEIEPLISTQIKIAKKHGEKTANASVKAFLNLTDRAFGKVTTPIGGDESMPLLIQISEVLAKKHGINASSK